MRALLRQPRALAICAIALSSAVMLVVLWLMHMGIAAAFLGLLAAIAVLWRRSVRSAIEATRLAVTDPLTGLGNRRLFYERLEQELTAAATTREPLALCLLDVDGLKRVNDTHGHPAGDRLLENVAGSLRHGGEAFRVGGDEFALLLVGRNVAEAVEAARAAVARIGVLDALEHERARVSAGLAVFPTHCARNDLYRCADDAMYESKRAGANEVVVFSPPSPPEMRSISGG